LLAWGHLPHLVRAGKSVITLRLESPARYHVWALASSGKRLAELSVQAKDDKLQFTADVTGSTTEGARMLYEVALN